MIFIKHVIELLVSVYLLKSEYYQLFDKRSSADIIYSYQESI